MRRLSRIRQVNAVLSAAMMALFLFHGVGNAFQLMGVGTLPSKVVSYALAALAAIHAVLGVILTVETMKADRGNSASYPLINLRFWAVRISGLAIAVLAFVHVAIFLQSSSGPVRLHAFEEFELVSSILLVVAIAVHVLINMEPFMVSLGIVPTRARAHDIAFAVAVLLILMVAAFVVYYLRWSVI